MNISCKRQGVEISLQKKELDQLKKALALVQQLEKYGQDNSAAGVRPGLEELITKYSKPEIV